MLWLLVIISAYFFFSIASFGDKLILAGPVNPKLYTFYVSVFGILAVLIIPFTQFGLPSKTALLWIVLEAIVFVLGVYSTFLALEKFDASRVMPAIGSIQPILILILTLLFWGSQMAGKINFLAFALLFLGSIVISVEKKFQISTDFLKLTIFSALMFSLEYVFSKLVFLNQPFFQGLIWMKICSFLLVLTFFFNQQFRAEVFSKQVVLNKKTATLFFFTQSVAGIAVFLQSFAVLLVPVAYLSILNSLRGIQYVFLFAATLFFSYFYPNILKEEISRKIVFQKIFSILLIIAGLVVLTSR